MSTYIYLGAILGTFLLLSCVFFSPLASFPLLSCCTQSTPAPISQFPPYTPFLSCPFLLCLAFSKQWKQWGEILGLNIAPIIAAKGTELIP